MSWEVSLITLALFVIALSLFGAWRGWSSRTRAQQQEIPAIPQALEQFGNLVSEVRCLYVATTKSSNHLDRITAHGLAFRGNAELRIFDNGLLITRDGERPIAIPSDKILDVKRSTAVIDKGVETDGLLTIDFESELSVHLRVKNQDQVLSTVSAIELLKKKREQFSE
ncbi:MAG: hypothetical protein RIR16_44 [Actinomycetota bacterium]|jgi:hypothetical protein